MGVLNWQTFYVQIKNYKIDFDELETNGKDSKRAYWVKVSSEVDGWGRQMSDGNSPYKEKG